MKKYRFIAFFCFLITSFLFLFGCQPQPSTNTPQSKTYSFFYDNPYTINDVVLTVSVLQTGVSLQSSNQNLRVSVTFTSSAKEKKTVSISSPYVINIPSSVKYETSCFFTELTLQYNIDSSISFHSVIPNKIENDQYALVFLVDNDKYIIYLSETPDSLRKDYTVSYIINNTSVHDIQIKDGRYLTNDYIWESDDHLYHCKDWFLDDKYQTSLSSKTVVENNFNVYGLRSQNLRTTSDSSGFFVWKINYVPSSKILVVPHSPTNKKVTLVSFCFYDNEEVKEIYLPKSLYKIANGNFEKTPNLEKIHFEGTKEEWEEVQSSSKIPATVTMVYNSYL